MDMFCRQCEQAAGGTGCTLQGVCGKSAPVSALQDALIHALKGIAVYGRKARELGARDAAVDEFLVEGLFTTVTNVNFDEERLFARIQRSREMKERAKALFLGAYEKKHGKAFSGTLPGVAAWEPAGTRGEVIAQGAQIGLLADKSRDEDVRSLRELILYGLKGMAAYADHARVLGRTDEGVDSFFHTALSALADGTLGAEALTGIMMELGKVNLRAMELLDAAHNAHFGTPAPVTVPTGVRKGPAIVVSGHDLEDLRQLLEQTEGTGVSVYTHGEMLPAHAYPELKKHAHLAGHFGTAWQNQQKEFDGQPVAVLMTTNCIQKPLASYRDRIFTTGLVAWPGVAHIDAAGGKKDFGPVIRKARELGGFTAARDGGNLMTGFAHHAVLSVAGTVIEAVKSGALRHIFLIGGCDGAKPGRSYYTEFALKVPKDCVILTLACGKFRFNGHDFGSLGGLPRLLDVGQCNDAYSAIRVASALAEAFKTTVNELPLSLVLSWYEQKAVCILITLLSLGIKNIRLGPSLPAFVSPNVLNFLVEKFQVKPITTPDQDLDDILGEKVER